MNISLDLKIFLRRITVPQCYQSNFRCRFYKLGLKVGVTEKSIKNLVALLFIKIIIPNEFKIFTSVMMRFIQSKNYDGYKCYYQKQTDKDNDKHDKINENVPPRNVNSATVRHTSNVPRDTPTRHANKTPQTRHFNNITIRSSKQSLIYQHLYTTSQQ